MLSTSVYPGTTNGQKGFYVCLFEQYVQRRSEGFEDAFNELADVEIGDNVLTVTRFLPSCPDQIPGPVYPPMSKIKVRVVCVAV